MTRALKITIFSFVVGALIATSCKKENHVEKTPFVCSGAEIYGYSSNWDWDTFHTCSYGQVNEFTGAITPLAYYTNGAHTTHGAYDPASGNYYIFRSRYFDATQNTIYKISSSGTVTSITGPDVGGAPAGLLFNQFNNKLYCISNVPSIGISEVNISGGTYTLSNVALPVHPVDVMFNVTVDQITGAMYYASIDGAGDSAYIERYHPGGGAPAVVATISGMWGLCFNASDSCLYGLSSVLGGGDGLVKINPASGTVTSFGYFSRFINLKRISTCIDPCNNTYIISTSDSVSSTAGRIYRLDLTGNLIGTSMTSGVVLGLDIKY